MGVIWTPSERTEQPSGSVQPVAGFKSGRVSLVVSARDASKPAKHTNVKLTKVNGLVGTLASARAVGNGITFSGSEYLTGLNDFTIVLYADLHPETGADALAMLLSLHDGTNIVQVSSDGNLASGSGGVGSLCFYAVKSGTYRIGCYADSQVDTGPAVYVMSMIGSSAKIYRNGVDVTTGTTVVGTRISAPSMVAYLHKPYEFVYQNLDSPIFMAAIIDGYGADQAGAAQLAQNPWQLFEPENDPVFYSLGGGGSTVTGVGSSDGVGTVSGVGASTSAQVGSSAGVGTATGVGTSTAASVGSSSGIGAADGVGSSTGGSNGVGASTGTGTATGIGASTAASTGSSDGVGTGSGVGASTAASVGSASGTGEALGVGTNGSVVSAGVGSASGTGTATGISPTVSRGGGKTTGSNLSRKQKKKLKAVESQEWLKAEETARHLLSDRFTKQTPQEKAQALETYIESLQPVIEALKALTSQIEEVVEEAPVIELTPHQEVIQRFDRLEKKVKSVEELIIILMADL